MYKKIKNLKITLITKYSEFKPIPNKVKIYKLHRFKNRTIDSIYFFIKSFFKLIQIHKKDPIHTIMIYHFFYELTIPFLIRLFFKIPLLIRPPTDFKTHQREEFMLYANSNLLKMGYYGWMKFLKKFMIHRKKVLIHAINNNIYNDFLNLNVEKENITKVPNGIPIKKYFGLKKKPQNEVHFGYVGRLIKSKNIHFLLKTFVKHLSQYPTDKLYIFGKGSEENFILKFIKENNLTENILLWGFEREKSKIYSNINVLIHPTFGEGFPNTLLEAILTETFVIASNVSGNKDIIEHKISGLLFNPFKERDLLKQLEFYKENQDLIPQILKNAKYKIISNYDIKVVANKIYQFLKSKL